MTLELFFEALLRLKIFKTLAINHAFVIFS